VTLFVLVVVAFLQTNHQWISLTRKGLNLQSDPSHDSASRGVRAGRGIVPEMNSVSQFCGREESSGRTNRVAEVKAVPTRECEPVEVVFLEK